MWLHNKNVVDVIATRLNAGVQSVETTIIQHGFVNFGSVVVGFVSDVSTRERVRIGCEAVSDEQAVVGEVPA